MSFAKALDARTVRAFLRCAVPAGLVVTQLVAFGAAARARQTDNPTRVEFHLLPASSSGPLDPDVSPNGEWVAFSMRGDLWKLPIAGGEAIALTHGPDWHFEPAWSPDGERLALVVEREGNFDVAVVPASGLEPGERARLLTVDPGYDLEPTWSSDGRWIYFATRRGGDLDVARVSSDEGADAIPEIVVGGRGNQFRPRLTLDGRRLLHLGPVPGLPGSGGVWLRDLTGGEEPRLVLAEETSYRAAPRFTADGARLVYSSDRAGTNDLAVLSVRGGQPIRLTEDPGDEFAAAPTPDGRELVFVSNHRGPSTLYAIDAAGGSRTSWREIRIESRDPRRPMGRLRARVTTRDGDGGSQDVVPARILSRAADGRTYPEEGGFLRRFLVNDTHYWHSDGSFELELPVGPAEVVAMRGFEHVPARVEVGVREDETAEVTLELERLIDLPSRGWWSGDTHSHDLHEGRFGLDQETFARQAIADDLHVMNALIHRDGSKVMGRWSDLTGEPYRRAVALPGALDPNDYLLFYTEEFRGSFGHVALLGLERFAMPLIGGSPGSPYPEDTLKLRYLDEVRAQGGIGGFVHPYNGPTDTPEQAAAADIAVHVALGRGEFYDVISVASQEWPTAAIYTRFLNAGFRLAATGGTDNFSDAFRDPSPGTARTYARLEAENGAAPRLSDGAWLDAVRQARTFASSGPLLLLEVAGAEPGDVLARDAEDPAELSFELEVASLVPLDRVEVVVNGDVAASFEPEGSERTWRFSGEVSAPEGGWIAARAVGPPHPWIGDTFPFAHTSPVWIEREGADPRSAEDARFLLETVDALWRRVQERDLFTTDAQRDSYRHSVEEARAVLRRIVEEASGRR